MPLSGYLVGGIAASLLLIGVIIFALLKYGNKKAQVDLRFRSGMSGDSHFHKLDEEAAVPSPLAPSTPEPLADSTPAGELKFLVEEAELERWEESNLQPH